MQELLKLSEDNNNAPDSNMDVVAGDKRKATPTPSDSSKRPRKDKGEEHVPPLTTKLDVTLVKKFSHLFVSLRLDYSEVQRSDLEDIRGSTGTSEGPWFPRTEPSIPALCWI